MFAPVAYPEHLEPLVRTIEDSAPDEIVAATCTALRAGRSVDELLLAAALAAVRSSDLPSVHHGGPVHPVAGLHATRHMATRLPGAHAWLPVVQSVALTTRHIHFDNGGPFILPEARPTSVNDSVADTLAALADPVRHGEHHVCEHYFLYLLEALPPLQVLEHLLQVATSKTILDDHYLLYPVYTWRVLQHFGWEYARHLVRPVVHFVTRPPAPPDSCRVDEILEQTGLLQRALRTETGEDETRAVAALGDDIGRCSDDFNEITHMLARALLHGVSLQGVGEGLSLGASRLFLRSRTRDWMEVHLNTTANTQRYLLGEPGIGLQTKLRALLAWDSGPDVRMVRRKLGPEAPSESARAVAPGSRSQAALLDDIETLITSLPAADGRGERGTHSDGKDAVDQVVAMTRRYGARGYDPAALMTLLGTLVCRDESSEMHAYKHHQATYEEFHTTRPSLRWTHMVAAAQGAAITRHREQRTFEEATRRLAEARID